MLGWLARFRLLLVLGGRALAVLAVWGFFRRMLTGRRATVIARTRSTRSSSTAGPPSAAVPRSTAPPP
jgi:hypothetical protein